MRSLSLLFFFLASYACASMLDLRHGTHIVSKDAGIDITTEKVVRLEGGFNAQTPFLASLQMFATANLPGDRIVIINSSGGFVDAGEMIWQPLQAERDMGIKIICVVDHYANSMAFNLLTRCDVRLATASATMLVHPIERGCDMGNGASRCTASEHRRLAVYLDGLDRRYSPVNAKAMRLSLKEYNQYAEKETVWSALQLRATGYLHGLATIE